MTDKFLVQELLRPTETCLICVELRYVKPNSERRKRLLAIVENHQEKEACVFLLRRKIGSALAIQHVLPIYHDFQLSVSQAKPVEVVNDAVVQRTGFIIKLTSLTTQMTLETPFLETLQTVLIQLKQFMNAARKSFYRVIF